MERGGHHLAKYFEYTTMQGDTWDILALDAYSDSFKSNVIIQANPEYSHIVVFNAGVKLKIPIIQAEPAATLPPWKR